MPKTPTKGTVTGRFISNKPSFEEIERPLPQSKLTQEIRYAKNGSHANPSAAQSLTPQASKRFHRQQIAENSGSNRTSQKRTYIPVYSSPDNQGKRRVIRTEEI